MRAIAVALSVLALAACGTGETPADDDAAEDGFTQRAEEVADAWAKADPAAEWTDELRLFDSAVVLPDVELTDEQSAAAAMGRYRLDASESEDSTASTVTLPNGSEVDVAAVPADDAFDRLAFGGEAPTDCDDADEDADDDTASSPTPCETLTVTAVEVGEAPRWTNHGLLELPAYLYTVDGVDGVVSQIAVDLPERPELPVVEVPEFDQGDDLKAAAYIAAVTESQIEYTIAVGACDERFKPLLYETDGFIVVAGSAVHDGSDVCTDQLLYQPVTVALDAPVGERLVIDAITGSVLTAGAAMF